MFRGFLVLRIVGTLLLIGLLVLGGFLIYNMGWRQGYVAGLLATGGEHAVPMHAGWGYPERAFGPGLVFGGLGLFFLIGMVVLLVVATSGIFRARRWRMAGQMPDGPWAQHGPWRHGPWAYGPVPPWCQAPGQGQPGQEKPAEKPPAEGGETQAQ
jgi:hypothetical protein